MRSFFPPSCRRFKRNCSAGSPKPNATWTGAGRAMLTACGSPKSCCSRRASRQCFPITSDSWHASQRSTRSRGRGWTPCCARGRASAITAARATCIAPQKKSWTGMAANSPDASRRHWPCPGSAITRLRLCSALLTVSRTPFSTATSRACWRAWAPFAEICGGRSDGASLPQPQTRCFPRKPPPLRDRPQAPETGIRR